MTVDPKLAPDAQAIPRVSPEEAAELTYFGSKLLHPAMIRPAVERNIPVRICNTREPDAPGTLITTTDDLGPSGPRAIGCRKGITVVLISQPKMLLATGFLRQVFEIFERHRTPVDLIATSEVSISVTIDDVEHLAEIKADLARLGDVRILRETAIVSLVGRGFFRYAGLARRIFDALADVNVVMISFAASDANVSVVVEEADTERAVHGLHREFFWKSASEAAAEEKSAQKAAGGPKKPEERLASTLRSLSSRRPPRRCERGLLQERFEAGHSDDESGTSPEAGPLRPAHEHDACGVGFVVDLKDRKSHDIVEQGAADPAQPRAPRRLRLRDEHRRRRRHPPADAARASSPRSATGSASSCRPPGDYGVGMVFLPTRRRRPRSTARRSVREDRPRRGAGRPRLARPCRPTTRMLGPTAAAGEPVIRQIFIGRGRDVRVERRRLAFERKLYVIRKLVENAVRATRTSPTSGHVLRPEPVVQDAHLQGHAQRAAARRLLPRPARPGVESALALVHSRFSTNTFPTWARAHPYRYSPTTARSTRCAATSTGCTPARACFASRAVRRRHREDPAGHRRERQRLGHVRQRPGAARAGRPLAAARDDDDDPRAVDRRHER